MNQKEFLEHFYEEVFNEHNLSKVEHYILENYIQHNERVEQGRQGFITFFQHMFTEINPNFHLDIQFMIEEGDKVMVYHQNVNSDGSINANIVDIYRFENGKLAEHWDILQQTH